MPVARDLSPDFNDPRICDFLMGPDASFTADINDKVGRWTANGYLHAENDARELAARPMPMRTFTHRAVEVRSPAGRLIQALEVVDPIDHPLRFVVVAVLCVKSGLDPALSGQIVNAFHATPPTGADVSGIETQLVRAGASIDDYQVELCFRLDRSGDPVFSETNLRIFREQVGSATDRAGRPLYNVHVKEDRHETCQAPNGSFDDATTLIVADADDPAHEIVAFENAANPRCDGLQLTDHRIGTAFQFYEWKLEWEVRPIRIGQCEIMRTKIPVIYSRIRKEALWCYAMTPGQIKANFEKAILDCLISAAEETAVLVIVTGGIGVGAAAVAFGNAFLHCFEQKIEDGVACIVGSLKLVAEYSDWEEKVF